MNYSEGSGHGVYQSRKRLLLLYYNNQPTLEISFILTTDGRRRTGPKHRYRYGDAGGETDCRGQSFPGCHGF